MKTCFRLGPALLLASLILPAALAARPVGADAQAALAPAATPERIDDQTVLDPATGRPVRSLLPPAAQEPRPPLPTARRALTDGYAGCSTSDNCAPFDLVTYAPGTAISLLPEGNYPYDATLNPAGSELWIPGASGDGVIVIDRATNTIIHRILRGQYPVSVAFSNDGSLALVANRDTEDLTLIDTSTYAVTDSLHVPTTYLGAGNIALDPQSGKFYLVDWYGHDFYEIAADGSVILRQVTLGDSLWQLVVAPDGQAIYVTDRGTDEVRIIDPETLTQVGSVPVGDDPWGIDVTADGGKLVVTCEDSHNVYVIDSATRDVTVIALNATADPRDVDILDSAHYAFVTGGAVSGGSNPVYVIDLQDNTLMDTFEAAGSNVNVVAVQPQMHQDLAAVGDDAPQLGAAIVAFPNPFNPETRVTYSLREDADVQLAVFDLHGRRVRLLDSARRTAGRHQAHWDGLDGQGQRAASGVYVLRLDAGRQSTSLKLVMTK